MKLLLKITAYCFISILTFSCNDNNIGFGANYEGLVYIAYLNDNHETFPIPNRYSLDSVELFYKDGSEYINAKELHPSIWDYRHLSEKLREYRLVINVDYPGNLDNTITLIKISETEIDTVEVEFRSGDNFKLIENVWYNGVRSGDASVTVYK